MLELSAFLIALLAALYLIVVAILSVFLPSAVARFLNGFASSASAHLSEMAIRLLVGWALVVNSSRMMFSDAFWLFGWILIVTSLLLLLVPWRWHRRFAQKVVAPLTRRAWLFGIFSFPLGVILLYATLSERFFH